MDEFLQFQREESKAKEYESLANATKEVNITESAYRDMNSRYLDAEKRVLQANEREDVTKKHLERKKEIERLWHQNTTEKKKELENRADKKHSTTDAAYYATFSLKELEVFIKNSDRGGNSKEYNNVATDLEVYNRVMSNEQAEENEGLKLLTNLKESCNTYLTTRKKTIWRTGTGKMRRAIIEQISIQVQEKINAQTEKIKSNCAKTKEDYQSEKSDENVNAVFKAHYDLVYQVLNGTIELTNEQRLALDNEMTEMMEDLKHVEKDDFQSDTLSTKFFNAIGWSSSKPKLVKRSALDDDGDAIKNSPIKARMYHSMDLIGNYEDATNLADQLAGTKPANNRLFYGKGRFGKGVYTSTKNNEPESTDQKAYLNSFNYGGLKGATMMIMTANEYARVATQKEVEEMVKIMEEKFPSLSRKIRTSERASAGGYQDFLTIFAAFFGINTIKGPSGIKGKNGGLADKDIIDYYTTTDRKALTISKKVEVRNADKNEDERENGIPYEDLDVYNLGTKQHDDTLINKQQEQK